MRKHLFIGVAISAVCLYFAFRGLSLGEVARAIGKADFRWLGIGLAVYGCGFLTRALRWQELVRPVKPIPASQLLPPMVIGFFANNVLPFRMGELVRAHVTGQKFGISRTASLGTIVLERIFDTISFLSIFLAVAAFYPFPSAVKHAAGVMGTVCLALIVFFWMASKHRAKTEAWLGRLPLSPVWRQKINHLLVNFTQGVSGMTQGTYVLRAVCLSMIVWIIEGSTVYFIARAFPTNLSVPQAFFLLFFLGLSVTLPQAPGYVGTVELFGVTALSLLGIPKELGLPVTLTIHASQFLFICGLGVWALWKEKLSLFKLIPAGKSAV